MAGAVGSWTARPRLLRRPHRAEPRSACGPPYRPFLGALLAHVLALRAVIRPLTIIIAAMLLSRPGMHRAEAVRYATVLQQEAREHDFDPLTGVAIINRESHWLPRVVSADGEDYGLAQIRARYIGACRGDTDPVHAPSEACRHVQKSLLDGAYNIRVMATLITRNRELCKQKTGTALFDQWLASYEGRNYPSSDKWCQSTEQTQQVVRYRRWLISKVVPVRAAKPKATARRGTSGDRNEAREGKPGRGKQRVKPKAAPGKRAAAPTTPRNKKR